MTECDHCGDHFRITTVLKNVRFDTSPVSKLVSTYTVCKGCRKELEDDPNVEGTGL